MSSIPSGDAKYWWDSNGFGLPRIGTAEYSASTHLPELKQVANAGHYNLTKQEEYRAGGHLSHCTLL